MASVKGKPHNPGPSSVLKLNSIAPISVASRNALFYFLTDSIAIIQIKYCYYLCSIDFKLREWRIRHDSRADCQYVYLIELRLKNEVKSSFDLRIRNGCPEFFTATRSYNTTDKNITCT